jgi:hypothetical protein
MRSLLDTNHELALKQGRIGYEPKTNLFWKIAADRSEVLYADLSKTEEKEIWHKYKEPYEIFLNKKINITAGFYDATMLKIKAHKALLNILQKSIEADKINLIPSKRLRNKAILEFAEKNTEFTVYCEEDDEIIKFFKNVELKTEELNLEQNMRINNVDCAPYWAAYTNAEQEYKIAHNISCTS